MITTGIAKYVYLDSTEKFNGEDTGKYTLTGAESEVQVLWKAGNEHPQHGVATYLTAVKVSKRTEGYKSSDDETNEFFA